MLRLAHWVLVCWYFVGPVLALIVAFRTMRRSRRPLAVMSWLMTAITAVVLGTLLAYVYAQAAGGQMMISQAALAAYFAAGLLFLLKAFDHVLRWLTERLFRVPRPVASSPGVTPTPEASDEDPLRVSAPVAPAEVDAAQAGSGGGAPEGSAAPNAAEDSPTSSLDEPHRRQPSQLPATVGTSAASGSALTSLTPRRPSPTPRPDPDPTHMLRRFGAFVTRVTLLFALGLPYVMTAVMTYRPRVLPVDPPRRPYEAIGFTASDGTRLSGWFVPADATRPDDAPAWWGRRTLLVCHGLASNKSNHLTLGQWGPQAGYNVLIFDHRAHGESSGQLTTFGLRESLDVLAAVGWLKAAKPEQSQKVFGIGASMGAAALITAAADRSPEGRAIDAVVVYGTFARLDGLSGSIARQHFVWPLSTLVKHIAIPLADVQTGRPLTAFAPADHIAQIWPRPVMIVHGLRDEIIPFEQGEALNEAATHPKRFRAVERAGHNDIVENPQVLQEVQHFLRTAEADPIL